MILFYTSWKYQKTSGFLTFSGGLEGEHRPQMVKHIEHNLVYSSMLTLYMFLPAGTICYIGIAHFHLL